MFSKHISLPLIYLCILPALLPGSACAQQQALNDDAVIKLVKGGLSDDLIVQTINTQPGAYTTGADDLMRLKQAGVSDRVLGAMLSKGSSPAVAPAASPASASAVAGVDEVGVYYKTHAGVWTQFAPEIINFKSGGALKSIASYGIVKQDKNGHIPGKSAKLVLTRQTDLLIFVPEGTSPEEYQLIKLRQNSDNREFRSETGGVFHNSSGAQRDAKAFTTVKIAPRMYQLSLSPELPVGEYGVLPPGSLTSSNAASAGKMYTFSLPE